MPPRKNKYFDVYLDRKLKPILEKCLKSDKVRTELIKHSLKENASGVVKLAVKKFLEDIDSSHASRKSDKTDVE